MQSSSSTQGGVAGGTSAAPAAGSSISEDDRDADDLFREQVASFATLEKLAENRGKLDAVKLFIEASPAGGFTPGAEFSDVDKLRELDRLAVLAKPLCDLAVSATLTQLTLGRGLNEDFLFC